MGTRIFTLGVLCAAALCSQHRFSWQEACFNNPGAPYCAGHEYAVRPHPAKREAGPRSVVSNRFATTPRAGNPSVLEIGRIDWRFADPFADAVVGFNVSALAASPLARQLIAQLGASQGLTDADMQKIFSGVSAVDQVALSLRGTKMVLMVTGPVTDSDLPAPEPGFKAVPLAGAMLMGHADAVDQALQRITMKWPPSETAGLAEQLQGNSEFWAIGSARLIGPQAVSAGVQRFTLRVWVRNGITGDMAFEFDGVPGAKTLQMLQTAAGPATVEGNIVHLRMAVEGDIVQQKFAGLVASPAGQRMAALVKAAQYLPARATADPKAKPVIYGLDEGPKVVGEDSR